MGLVEWLGFFALWFLFFSFPKKLPKGFGVDLKRTKVTMVYNW